ncbi:MAG: hypothetical protein JWP12_3328 [Bacteroidetes bacterium]|nr:hypothetical protein [Bacteroidota bacterium]
MQKRTLVFILIVSTFHFSFSQEEKPIPYHFIKINIFNAPFGEVIGFYEYFNGKSKGWEFGLSYIYPVKHMQDNVLQLYPTLYYARGFSARCARRFYVPAKKGFLFLGPSLVFKYKNIHNDKIQLDKGTDTEALISQEKYVTSLLATFGFAKPEKNKLKFEIYCALGVSMISNNTDYHRYYVESIPASSNQFYYRQKPRLMYDNTLFFFPVIELGYKFLFTVKGRRKE